MRLSRGMGSLVLLLAVSTSVSVAAKLGALSGAGINPAVIGMNQPPQDITVERIARLPVVQRAAWVAYLHHSEEQRKVDKAKLAAERTPGVPIPEMPKESPGARSMPLHQEAAWYGSPEARHIADVILSFQTPAGGWSKNLDMSGAPRTKGQSYTPDNLSKHLSEADFDAPKEPQWNYVGTLDNDATVTELRFLALVAGQAGDAAARYRESFLRGVRYLLNAQFPNGGWPQVWPLEGGYHDAITYNDNAVTQTADLMTTVAAGEGDYAFVPANLRAEADKSARHALQCILDTQFKVKGKRAGWAQQQDALTFEPESGRNYEPASLASSESADVLLYLMALPNPSKAVVAAVESGIQWLTSAEIQGQEWTSKTSPGGRTLVAKPGAGPLWARYYDLATDRPVFGDRDKTLHDDVNDLSRERRNGYSWFNESPAKALAAYKTWSAKSIPATEVLKK